MLIIFTDGFQTQKHRFPRPDQVIRPGDNSKRLLNRVNVTIFAVGAGTPDPIELLSMATGRNAIRARLENLDEAVGQIIKKICKIEVTVSVFFVEVIMNNDHADLTRRRRQTWGIPRESRV